MDERTLILIQPATPDYTLYIRAARRRAEGERQALRTRYQRAWALARRAAALLRERYAAQRVVLFGSLLHQEHFTARSDVDLAVWGIPWPAYLHALGQVWELDADIAMDLVDTACCSPVLLEIIESEGMEL